MIFFAPDFDTISDITMSLPCRKIIYFFNLFMFLPVKGKSSFFSTAFLSLQQINSFFGEAD